MYRIPLLSTILGTLVGLALQTAPLHAQATRTWVSGVGDDANPCSRTAPCKTFAGAISKTAAAGEINCLDPGGFGGVTIQKSLAIKCNYTEGGVLVAGTAGITVNTAASDVVYLEGLDIFGTSAATNGINFIQGGVLHVKNTVIRQFTNGGAGLGNGIRFAPTLVDAELHVTDSYISDNGGGDPGAAGILVAPTGAGGAKVIVDNTHMDNNTNGFRAFSAAANTGGIRATVRNSTAAGNSTNGFTASSAAGGGVIGLYLERNASVSNTNGVVSDGAQAFVHINVNTIANNTGSGLAETNGGTLATYQNNGVIANNPDGATNLVDTPK